MKKWYQIIEIYPNGAGGLRGEEISNASDDRYLAQKAPKLPVDYLTRFRLTIQIKRPQDLVPNNLGWKVLSNRAGSVLDNVPQHNCDFYELGVGADAKGGPFWLLHPRVSAKVLDLTTSLCSRAMNPDGREYISSIQRLRVVPYIDSIGSSVIRVHEYFPIVVVNSDFTDAWRKAGLKGIEFDPV